MLKSLLIVIIWLCLLSSCSTETINARDKETYDKQKASLSDQEKTKPLSFLRLYASNKKNVFGSTVVTGAVANLATVSSYKDVRVKLLSFDDGRILEEHEDILTGIIRPNDSRDFKLRYHLPKTTDSVAVSIMSADVAE